MSSLRLLVRVAFVITMSGAGRAQFVAHHLRHGNGGALHSAVNRLEEGSSFEVGAVDPAAPYTFLDGASVHRRMWLSSYADLASFYAGYRAPTFDDSIAAVHGRRALKIDTTNGDFALVTFQPIRIESGQGGSHTFSAYFRTTAADAIPGVKLTIRNMLVTSERSDAITTVTGAAWTRIAVTHNCAAGTWYELYLTTGNYSQPLTSANGSLWVDAVQFERAAAASSFEYHTQAQELGAFTTDGAQPRAGNLFSSDDGVVRLVLQVFEQSQLAVSPASQVQWTLRDRNGVVRASGNQALQPSPTSFQELELADVDAALDASVGDAWRGWFRADLDLVDGTGQVVDHEEVVLARYEATPPTSRRFPRSPFGTHLLESASGSEGAFGHVLELNQGLENWFSLAASIGVRWQRMNNSFAWAFCNPADGVYRFNESGLELGDRYGLTPLCNTRAIPNWVPKVTSSLGKPIVAPGAWGEYDEFLDELHHRFDDPGATRITWYEVENEPDHPYQPHYAPADYWEFLRRADSAAQAPDLLVAPKLAGPAGAVTPLGTFGNTWLDQLLAIPGAYDALGACTKHYYNWPVSGVDGSGAAWHQTGYPELVPPPAADHPMLEQEIAEVRGTIAAAAVATAGAEIPLWFTEIGWFTPRNQSDVPHHHSSASATTIVFPGMSGSIERAREPGEWLVRTYVVGLSAGAAKIFTLSLPSPPSASAGNTFGLLDHDLTPTVELTAYAALTARLGPVPQPLRRIQASDVPLAAPSPAVRAYLFRVERGFGPSVGATPGGGPLAEWTQESVRPSLVRTVAVIWNADALAPIAMLDDVALAPATQIDAFDLEGNHVALAGASTFDLALSSAPIYLEAASGISAAEIAAALDIVPPAQLPQPTAFLNGPSDTKVVWNANAASYDVVAYRVYREGPPATWTLLAEVQGRSASTWTDTSPQNNCSYRVSSVEALTAREGPQSPTSVCILPP